MTLLKGLVLLNSIGNNTKVCKLQKSLYKLKQASRHWYSKLFDSLLSLGYKHFIADYSLLTIHHNSSFIALLIYVGDIVLAENDFSEIQYVKSYLHDCFKIKDLGNLRFFPGIEVVRSSKDIIINKRKYMLELL